MSEMIHPSAPSTAPSAAGRPWWLLIGTGLGAMAAACQLAVLVGPLLGAVQRDLGSRAVLTLVVVAQLIALASGFAAGYLLGRRAPAVVTGSALVLMLLGAVVAALSPSAAMLTIAVLPAGLGQGAALGAGVASTGQADERQTQVRLALGLASFVALGAGALLGRFATTSLGWRWAFLATVPTVLAALLAIMVIAAATSGRGTQARR